MGFFKRGFCFFWASKEKDSSYIDDLPALNRGGQVSFVLKQKAPKVQERTKLQPSRPYSRPAVLSSHRAGIVLLLK